MSRTNSLPRPFLLLGFPLSTSPGGLLSKPWFDAVTATSRKQGKNDVSLPKQPRLSIMHTCALAQELVIHGQCTRRQDGCDHHKFHGDLQSTRPPPTKFFATYLWVGAYERNEIALNLIFRRAKSLQVMYT